MAWPVSEAREAFSVSLMSTVSLTRAPSLYSLFWLWYTPVSTSRVRKCHKCFFRAISLFLGERERQKEKKGGRGDPA